ncbi:MAG: hypothetical protein ACREEC_12975, partial [Thermoplasmata archaeon]
MSPSARSIARQLALRDPVMRRVIRRVGVHELVVRGSGFPALVRAIVYQQISGAAGSSILRKVLASAGTDSTPGHDWFLAARTPTLRRAGLSPQKIGYLRD